MPWPLRLIPVVIALVLGLAACAAPGGSGEEPVDDRDTPAPNGDGDPAADGVLVIEGGVADGPGITIDSALEQAGGEFPLLVNGALFIEAGGDVWLCEAIAESFPPQCAGDRLRVEGLDPSGFPDLQEAGDLRWLDSTQVFGRVSIEE